MIFHDEPTSRIWELINCGEHQQLIEYVKGGNPEKAFRLWRDSHWSFKAYETFIRRFYADSEAHIALAFGLALRGEPFSVGGAANRPQLMGRSHLTVRVFTPYDWGNR